MSGAVHVERVGRGPALVLVHGWAMHGGVFAPLVERLAPRFTLHLVDLPGHGHAAASTTPLALEPVVEALMDAVPRATWLGWSLGGLFALHAAATRPGQVAGVAMVCASPRFVGTDAAAADPWAHGVPAQVFRDFATGLRDDYRGTLDRFIALEAFGSDTARAEMRTLRHDLFARGEPAAAVLADGLRLLETSDLRSVLPELAVPSLWLSGRRDRLVDPRSMADAAALAPAARHACIAHAGHAPFLAHAGEVAAEVDAFAAACATEGASA